MQGVYDGRKNQCDAFTGTKENPFNMKVIIDIKKSTTASNFKYDVNLLVGGQTDGNVYANTNLEIIEDIYSTELDLLPEKENITYELNTETVTEDITLRGTISIPEDENIKILKLIVKIYIM